MTTDGTCYRAMVRFKPVKLPVFDDFPTTSMEAVNSVVLFVIFETIEGERSTPIASQLELSEWYLRIEGELNTYSTLGYEVSACRYLDIEGPSCTNELPKTNQEG